MRVFIFFKTTESHKYWYIKYFCVQISLLYFCICFLVFSILVSNFQCPVSTMLYTHFSSSLSLINITDFTIILYILGDYSSFPWREFCYWWCQILFYLFIGSRVIARNCGRNAFTGLFLNENQAAYLINGWVKWTTVLY